MKKRIVDLSGFNITEINDGIKIIEDLIIHFAGVSVINLTIRNSVVSVIKYLTFSKFALQINQKF